MSKPFKCEFFYNLGELTIHITWYSLEKKVIHLSAIPDDVVEYLESKYSTDISTLLVTVLAIARYCDDFGSKWDGIVPEEAIRKLL